VALKPETRFKNKIRPLLKRLPNSYWVKVAQVSTRGVPDYLGCINGHFIALELKCSDKEKPDPLQQWHLNQIAMAGGFGIAVCPENWEVVYEMLKEFACNNSKPD